LCPVFFYLQFEYDDGNQKQYGSDYGRWSGDGSILTLTIQPNDPGARTYVDTYEIIELNSSYFVYRAVDPDCIG